MKGLGITACALAVAGLAGCASSTKVKSGSESLAIHDPASSALARSADEVSQSIRKLAEVEQYDRFQKLPGPLGPYDQVPDMVQMVTMPWDGPVESAAEQLTQHAKYQFKVSGRSPVIPILVRIGAQPATVSDHLRNIGMQAGSRADLIVYPQQRIVELRYSDAGI